MVTLHSLVGGTSADWQLSESVTWDSADFTSASFAATDSNMNGGVNQSSPIYSYVMPLAGGYDANGNLLTASDSVMGQWTYSYDSAGAKPESLRRETTRGRSTRLSVSFDMPQIPTRPPNSGFAPIRLTGAQAGDWVVGWMGELRDGRA